MNRFSLPIAVTAFLSLSSVASAQMRVPPTSSHGPRFAVHKVA